MVNITESTYSSYIAYNGNLANFEYFYSNGTIIPAWIESNSSGKLITWVKTISIPASSHIQIYLGFASKTTNLLSNTGTSGIGEAPQLSSTYAEYDNGANVFPFYDNFAGTTLSSKWTVVSGVAGTDYIVNNGIRLLTNTPRIQSVATFNQNFILEAYNQFVSDAPDGWSFGLFSSTTDAYGILPGGSSSVNAWSSTWYYNNGWTEIATTGETIGAGYYFLWQVINNAGTITTNFDSPSYSTYYTGSFTNTGTGLPIAFSERFDNAHTAEAMNDTIYWIRTRAYPPSGVMPSAAFGIIVVTPPATLTISPNPSVYGQAVTLTASCQPTDSCAIDYPTLGTHIATGTGSATYTYNA
ncbi:hypothetical protein M1367_00005, partial [Candidatus Marsarchaeota archaeon]|nr:hypothetical protein [Candidatus Marsarchaeota archaeon]